MNNDIQKIVTILENNDGVALVGLRPYLEKAFSAKAIDFSFAGAPHYTIKTKKGDILICNVQYAEEPDAVVGTVAVGFNL